MPREHHQAQALGECSPSPDPTTGLVPAEMDARDAMTSAWAQRVLQLQTETGCSMADALRAIEDSTTLLTFTEKHRKGA